MSRPRILDPAAPVAALVALAAAAGVSERELARRLGKAQTTVLGYRDKGDRVQLSTLRACAAALGKTVQIRLIDAPSKKDSDSP